MSSRVAKIDTGAFACASFITSAVIHLAVFLCLVWWGRLFPSQIAIQETYFVDVVNLPTADPRSGSSAHKPVETSAETPRTQAPAMVVPSPHGTASKVVTKMSHQEAAETEAAFEERMAQIERNSDARHEESVLEKLRNKLKAGSSQKTGTLAASGAEAGSNYANYIKSRLEDALKMTSSYTTKNPEVSVILTISTDGRLSRMKIERSSGDAAFELAVRRAIDLASAKFTAPPNHSKFENGFVFRPKGISNGTSR